MSSASASSGGAGPEIAALLHEFTLGLGAAPAERPLEPAFDDRMREVMVKLVDSVMSPLGESRAGCSGICKPGERLGRSLPLRRPRSGAEPPS